MGELPENIGHTGIEVELAKHITVNPIGIDKLQISFDYTSELSEKNGDEEKNDFFSGLYKNQEYELTSASFTTRKNSSMSSSITTQTQDMPIGIILDTNPSSRVSPSFEYTYNFTDSLQVLVNYTLSDNTQGAFGIYIDPYAANTGNIHARNNSASFNLTEYIIYNGMLFQSSNSGPLIAMDKTRRVPDGYTEVEYIESNGTQYIDTGIKGNSTTTYDIQITNPGTRQLGGYGASSNEYWGINGNVYEFGGTTTSCTVGNRDTIVWEYIYRSTGSTAKGIINGEIFYNTTSAVNESNTMKLGYIGGSWNKIQAKFYHFTMEQNGNIVFDGIPCIQDSTGKVGLYNTVNGKFYGNNGTGNYVAGMPVQYEYVHLYKDNNVPSSPVLVLSSNGRISSLSDLIKMHDIIADSDNDVEKAIKNCVSVSVTGIDELTVDFSDEIFDIAQSVNYFTSKTVNGIGFTSSDIVSGIITPDNLSLKLKYNFKDTYIMKLDYYLYDGTKSSIDIDITTSGLTDDTSHYVSGGKIYNKSDDSLALSSAFELSIPEDYTLVQYIESTGKQYINTNIKGNTESVYDIQFTTLGTRQLGGYGTSSNEYWGINGNVYEFGGTKTTYPAGNRDLVEWKYLYSSSGSQLSCSVNGQVLVSGTSVTNESGRSLMIGNIGSGWEMYKAKIYMCTVSQNGECKFFGLPCKDGNNNYFLFDIVSGKAFKSASSTGFVGTSETIEINTGFIHIFDGKALDAFGNIVDIP